MNSNKSLRAHFGKNMSKQGMEINHTLRSNIVITNQVLLKPIMTKFNSDEIENYPKRNERYNSQNQI